MATKVKEEATVLGIIYIGAGSSWYQCTEEVKCAIECANICKQDWGHLFKFKRKQDFPVNLYDISKSKGGWWSDGGGVYEDGTQKPVPRIKTMYVVV